MSPQGNDVTRSPTELQVFSTVIGERESSRAFNVVSIPSRSADSPESVLDVGRLLEVLGVDRLADIATEDDFLAALGFIEEYRRPKTSSGSESRALPMAAPSIPHIDFNSLRGSVDSSFLRELFSGPYIPVEQSPLKAESFSNLFAMAKGASLNSVGAVLGYEVSGRSPLLLITVPAGIILVKAAVGVGDGLNAGLKHRIEREILKWKRRKPQ